MERIVQHALEKKPESRYSSAEEMLKDLKEYQKSLQAPEGGVLNAKVLLRRVRNPQIAVPVLIVTLALGLLGAWFFKRQAQTRWAERDLLPRIGQLVEAGRDNYI